MIKCEFSEDYWDEGEFYEHIKVEYYTDKMYVWADVIVNYRENERGRLVVTDEIFPYNFIDFDFRRYDENGDETESLEGEKALKEMTNEEFAEFEKNMVQFFDYL